MTTVRLSFSEIQNLVSRVLVSHGTLADSADIVAGVVAGAERDGTLSHGLLRVPGYVSTLKSGWVDGLAVPVITDVAPGLMVADARNGFAQVAIAASRDQLITKVRRQGIASLAIRNSHHFASVYADVEPLAEAGFVALSFVNSRSRIVPSGGVTKLFGSNPMAFACPRASGPPLVFDQASSVMSQGEVLLAAKQKKALPPGVGIDAGGRPTTDAEAVLNGGALLPFGGHKGSSIALMIELLAAAVTGAEFGVEDGSPAFAGAQTSRAGQLIIVMDPKRSAGESFTSRVDELLAHIPGNGNARLPGERRRLARQAAEQNGVLVEETVLHGIHDLLD